MLFIPDGTWYVQYKIGMFGMRIFRYRYFKLDRKIP